MRRSLILAVPVVFLLTACFGPQSPAPVSHYGGTKGPGSAGIHTVVEGDTLYSISQRYNIVMRDIALSNNINAPFRLSEGQRLRLPPPQEYRVRAGDSLYTVSRLFGVSTSEVAQTNSLRSPYVIKAGQVLRLPSMTRKAETTKLTSLTPTSSASLMEGGRGRVSDVGDTTDTVNPHPSPPPQAGGDKKVVKKSEARAKITAKTPKRSSAKFMTPVEGTIISSYGPKKDGLHNDGINIKAPKGAPVHAAENGVVVYAGNELKGSGNLVLVRHEGRWMTAYAHMDRTLIKRGDVIKRGQTIGTVGSTGSVDTPQLHFEVRRGTEAINPTVYLEG